MMVVKVQKVSRGYAVLIPQQACEEWALQEGSMVEVHRLGSVQVERRTSYASKEEIMEAFQATLAEHEAMQRDMNRGPEEAGMPDVEPVDWWKL